MSSRSPRTPGPVLVTWTSPGSASPTSSNTTVPTPTRSSRSLTPNQTLRSAAWSTQLSSRAKPPGTTQPTSPSKLSNTSSAISTGTAWSPRTNSKTPGSTKASTPTPRPNLSALSSAATPPYSTVPTQTPATTNCNASSICSCPTTIPSSAGPSSSVTPIP